MVKAPSDKQKKFQLWIVVHTCHRLRRMEFNQTKDLSGFFYNDLRVKFNIFLKKLDKKSTKKSNEIIIDIMIGLFKSIHF